MEKQKRYDQIHETVLKDIFDIYDGIHDLVQDGGMEKLLNMSINDRKRTFSSIAKQSNDLICVFPVLSSRAISIENQSVVAKAIEKNCVAMLQMVFSALQLSDYPSAQDYISQFHTNLSKTSKAFNIDDLIEIGDRIGAVGESTTIPMEVKNKVRNDMKNLNFYFLGENVSNLSLDDKFTCNLTSDGKYIVEAGVIDKVKRIKDLEADNKILTDKYKTLAANANSIDKENIQLRSDLKKVNRSLDDMTDQRNRARVAELRAKDYNHKMSNQADIYKAQSNATETFAKQVLNTEYKKANELMPTLMVINFKVKTPDGYETLDSAIIGVKAKLYPISSEDMITHLVSKSNEANWTQRFIKATTREISFFKDFLFAVDKAKVDALSMSKKGSTNKMWKVLERRATKSKFNRMLVRKNDASAITTIMISQQEVDYVKKEFLIDLADVSNARVLMNAYNLLGICIVDESLEIAKFIWDTDEDVWETISFTNLERDSNDTTYKKVVNLMTKIV